MTDVAVHGGPTKAQKRAVFSATVSGFVVAAVTGKRIKVYGYSIQARTDGASAKLTDGNGGADLTHVWTLNAREGACPPFTTPNTYICATTKDNGLYAVLTGGQTVDIDVSYWDDDAT